MALTVPLFQKYDAPTTLTYGKFSQEIVARKPAKTSGSSTTVSAVTAGDLPFAGIGAGSELHVNRDGEHDVVYFTPDGGGDNDTGTVDAAVDWSTGPGGSTGRHFRFRHFLSGTTAADGWIPCREYTGMKIQLIVHSFNAASVTFSIEGRVKFPQATPTVITTKQFTATGSDFVDLQPLDAPWDEVRVGVIVAGDTGANSVSVAAVCVN